MNNENTDNIDWYKCQHCEKTFANIRDILSHEKKHERMTYPCEKCYKIFQLKQALHDHMISHELLAASACNLCVTTFSTPPNLKKHLRNVHDHKPTISNGKDFIQFDDNIRVHQNLGSCCSYNRMLHWSL